MKLLLLLAYIALATSASAPRWPVKFQAEFTETFTYTQFKQIGKIWYQSDHNRQRVDRTNGQFNKLCSEIESINTLCVQLVSNQKRWFYYPFLKKCCFCCDEYHGCGITSRNWLQNSKFTAVQDINGQSFNKFVEDDLQVEYWQTTDTRRIPRRQIEQRTVTRDYLMNTYSEQNIADIIFSLPLYCSQNNVCPGSCARYR